MEYEIIYQLDAIEYLFVFFQLDMFRAERTQINTQLHQVGKLFHISNQNQGKTTQSGYMGFLLFCTRLG